MDGFWKRIFGKPVLPAPDTIREPTLAEVFGICCGPRLLQKALRLHGEDLAKRPEEEEKKADS